MQGKYRILAFLVQYTVFNICNLKVQLKFHVDPLGRKLKNTRYVTRWYLIYKTETC